MTLKIQISRNKRQFQELKGHVNLTSIAPEYWKNQVKDVKNVLSISQQSFLSHGILI